MSKLLDSSTFGDRLYQSLPEIYRSEDERVNFALKRYFNSLAEGGFSKVIEETNNLSNLVDPEKIDSDLLPVLFKNYGMEIFHGIPELYLRKLLPMISSLYSLKGTITSVGYITSLVSGVKSTVEVSDTFNVDHAVDVKLEMDYKSGTDGLPEREQLLRIIQEFVPFFCNVTLVYAYFFQDSFTITLGDNSSFDMVFDTENGNVTMTLVDTSENASMKDPHNETPTLIGSENTLETFSVSELEQKVVSIIESFVESNIESNGESSSGMLFNDEEIETLHSLDSELSSLKIPIDYNSLVGDPSCFIGDTMLLNNVVSYDIIRTSSGETPLFHLI